MVHFVGLLNRAIHFIVDNFTYVIQNHTAKTQQKKICDSKISDALEIAAQVLTYRKAWEEKYRNQMTNSLSWKSLKGRNSLIEIKLLFSFSSNSLTNSLSWRSFKGQNSLIEFKFLFRFSSVSFPLLILSHKNLLEGYLN